jgi:Bacterial membrane protein YfhO
VQTGQLNHITANSPPTWAMFARKHSWALGALLLLTVFLGVNSKLLEGRAAPLWDANDLFAPYFTLIADHARVGKILLWEPWTSGGTPASAEPEFGSFSPLTIGVGALTGGSEAGFRVYWLLIWLLGPLGILVFARYLGAPPWGAFVVAMGFAFSGIYVGMAEHTPMLYSFAFLPFFLWRLDVALSSRRFKPAAEAGALWGLSALAGYPALTILSWGFLFLWAIGRWCFFVAEEDGPTVRRSPLRRSGAFTLLALLLFSSVGALVLSPSYVAFFRDARGYSDRVGVRSRQEALENQAFHPGALATFASPYLSILQLYNPKLWDITDVSLSSVYLGASIPILGLLALAIRPRSRWRWWIAGIGLFFLLSAMGKHVPLRGWLYDFVPPTRYFRAAALFRMYAMFSMALLALFATRDLKASLEDISSPIRKRFVIVATVVAATALTAYGFVMSSVDKIGPNSRRANLDVCLTWLGVLAISLAILSKRGRRSLPFLLGGLAIMDAVLSFGISSVTIYDWGSARTSWNTISAGHSSRLDLTSSGLTRDLRPAEWLGPELNDRNIPLRIATFENYAPLGNRFQTDFANAPVTVAMSTGAQRIWFSTQVASVTPNDSSYAAFVSRTKGLGAPVLVVHPRQKMLSGYGPGEASGGHTQDVEAIANLAASQRLSATVLRYSPNELSLEVSCPDSGWLLVTDRWSPGWQATVNGKRVEVSGGDFIFRAVPVQQGANTVTFSYLPAGWPTLLILSWGTLFVVLGGPILRQVIELRVSRKNHIGAYTKHP